MAAGKSGSHTSRVATDIVCGACRAPRRVGWMRKVEDLLPVGYFHVEFTVPSDVAAIALRNKRDLYARGGPGLDRS